MRRSNKVPAKMLLGGITPPRGRIKALRLKLSSLRFKGNQQNIPIKEYATSEFEIARYSGLIQIYPLTTPIQELGNFFDGKVGGVHIDLFSLTTILFMRSPYTINHTTKFCQ